MEPKVLTLARPEHQVRKSRPPIKAVKMWIGRHKSKIGAKCGSPLHRGAAEHPVYRAPGVVAGPVVTEEPPA